MDGLASTAKNAAGDNLMAGRAVAVVHEWYGPTGGSEMVFQAIAGLMPHAERYVLWKDHDADSPGLQESWLGRTPLRRSKALALPVMPLAWRTLTRSRFDVVISSSHAFAHTVKAGHPGTRYLSYIHSPARYIWSPDFDGRGSSAALAGPRKILQWVDRRMSEHVNSYAANSREVQARIRRYWHRESCVIYPPVDVDYFAGAPQVDGDKDHDYLLGVGRWIGYKNFDLMIEIAHLARAPLVLAGSGPDEGKLRQHARKVDVPVLFEVRPSRERLRELYWGASALLYPAHEDFGIVPVEAQACGTPVVGLNRGGLLETVRDGETGFLVDSLDPADYVARLKRVEDLNKATIRSQASGFSKGAFSARIAEWVASEVDN